MYFDNNFFSVNCTTVNNGDIGYCACKQSCNENEGDCDFNYHCQDGHRCGSNNCPNSYDCCYVAINGDEDFCTFDNPCGADEGDCDSDDECQSELFCELNNCLNSIGVSSTIDCCEPQGKLSINFNTIFEWYLFTY